MLIFVTTIFTLLILARTFFFLVQVEGWSMYPTYQPGDHLLALRYWTQCRLCRGQVVVWKLPPDLSVAAIRESMSTRLCIKRIIGLPGDEVIAPLVKITEAEEERFHGQELHRWNIPAGFCFVKGDSAGFDSTFFGPLPLHALRGLIVMRLPRHIRTVEEPYYTDSFPSSRSLPKSK